MLKVLFYLSLAALTLGQFSAVYKSQGVNIYLFDVLLAIYALFGLFNFLSKKTLVIPKPYFLLFLFSMVGGISLLIASPNFAGVELLIAAFYLVRLVVYLSAALITVNLIKSGQLSLNSVVKAILLSGAALVILGFVQLYLLPDFEVLDPALGWDPHKYRLASTFFDPNFVGAYLSICFLLLLEFPKTLSTKKGSAVWYFSYLVLILVGVLLTFSRSAWLTFGVTTFMYGLFRKRWLLVVALLSMFLGYYAVPRVQTRLAGTTDPADSAQFRLVSWQNTAVIIKDNWLFGVGYNTLRYVQRDYGFLDLDALYGHSASGSDSSVLYILATTGVVGFVTFVLAILAIISTAVKKKLSVLFFITLMLAFGLNSQFINSVFYPQIMFVWMILAGFSSISRT
jgi:O-antigen ligase